MSGQTSEQEKEAKLQEFWERARKGVLKYLQGKGGSLSLGELHEYSMTTYFIQHQRFSLMMETFVQGDLVEYDDLTQKVTISGKGKEFIQ